MDSSCYRRKDSRVYGLSLHRNSRGATRWNFRPQTSWGISVRYWSTILKYRKNVATSNYQTSTSLRSSSQAYPPSTPVRTQNFPVGFSLSGIMKEPKVPHSNRPASWRALGKKYLTALSRRRTTSHFIGQRPEGNPSFSG